MDEKPVSFRIEVPDEIQGGVYANMLSVWHTPHEFTLDFSATLPTENTEDGVVVPCRVTSRVKVPPTLLFDLLSALNENMTLYEEAFGEIKRPGEGSDGGTE